jgi:hypothetical protein
MKASDLGIRTRSGTGLSLAFLYLKAATGTVILTNCRFYDSTGRMILSGIGGAAISLDLTTSYVSLQTLVENEGANGVTAWNSIKDSIAGFESDNVSAQVDCSFGDPAALVPTLIVATGRPVRVGHGIPAEKQAMMGATVNVSGEVETASAWKTTFGAAVVTMEDVATSIWQLTCSGYCQLVIDVLTAGATHAVNIQVSMDGTNWRNTRGVYLLTAGFNTYNNTSLYSFIVGSRMFIDTTGFRYVRLAQSGAEVAGVFSTFTYSLTAAPFVPPTPVISNNGAALVQLQAQTTHASTAGGTLVPTALEARTTRPTSVTNGQATRGQADKDGRSVVTNGSIPEEKWSFPGTSGASGNPITTAAGSITILAAAAGMRGVLTSLMVVNNSTTDTVVTLKNGTTVHAEIPLGLNKIKGFVLPAEIVGATNTAWTVESSAAGASVYVACAAGHKING